MKLSLKPKETLRNVRSRSLKLNPRAKGYKRFANLLVSPHTGERLFEKDGGLVTKSGRRYSLLGGVPILVVKEEEMHVTPPVIGKVSHTSETYAPDKRFNSAKTILHLGSGDVKCTDPRVVSLDILPLPNVDIVAEAEALPFANDCFDLVESCAVFEHVYDPLAAIKEVKRVLKPGGIFLIDNSFFQPYHGFPSHYFAMTPQANETFLADDFILLDSSIPGFGGPAMSLRMVLERFLVNLSSDQKPKVMKMPVGKLLELLQADSSGKNPLVRDFSEYEKRAIAATHVVIAKKPRSYEKRLAKIKQKPETFENWSRSKREYYTLRTEIMMRHHETFMYKRMALEINPRYRFTGVKFPDSLEKILKPGLLTDPLDMAELNQKIGVLKNAEQALTATRNTVINIFMELRDRPSKKTS